MGTGMDIPGCRQISDHKPHRQLRRGQPQAQRCTFLWVLCQRQSWRKGPCAVFGRKLSIIEVGDSEVSSTQSKSWGCRVGSGWADSLRPEEEENGASKTWAQSRVPPHPGLRVVYCLAYCTLTKWLLSWCFYYSHHTFVVIIYWQQEGLGEGTILYCGPRAENTMQFGLCLK